MLLGACTVLMKWQLFSVFVLNILLNVNFLVNVNVNVNVSVNVLVECSC